MKDIAFDYNGYVYLATDLGISILETAFVENKAPDEISISPNPYRIGLHNEIIISNIPKDSKVKIMTLTGKVVKDFYVDQDNMFFSWNGSDNKGNILHTGVYLVSIYNEKHGTGVTKLAIIH